MASLARIGFAFASIAFIGAMHDAAAQITRPFTIRYSANDNGDIKLVGNAVMTCGAMPLTGNCALAAAGTANGTGLNNNDFAMTNIDVDGDATTFNSSQATLTMPPGSTVLFAGLYWGATSNSAQRNQVLFRTPTAFGYAAITASVLDTAGGQANNYSGFANVTALVSAAGNGVYTVANVRTTQAAGNWGGWVLVVVYQNLSESVKNLVVYDGYGLVNNANPVTVVPSGFLTPLSGPVVTRVGASGYDGDLNLTGDGFSVNGTALTDSLNQTNNFFNSVISENGVQLPGRNPSFVNNFGTDVDRVNVPTGVVPNGATSATLQLTAPSENYHPNVLTFATDIYVPVIASNVVKTLTDLNGPPLLPGDPIRWTISMSNTGFDTGTNLILKDPIPANTTYTANSLQILTGANSGMKSDGAGDDQAEYSVSAAACMPVTAPCVIYRLGSGANAAMGGSLAYTESTSISFDSIVNMGIPAGTSITNSATVSYSGQTLGATFSTTSASATGTVLTAPTISKSFSPNVINGGGTSTLTIVVANPAANPATLTGVSFNDAYPMAITNAAMPAANVVCTGGSTPGTITGGTAGGNSIGMSPGASILPGGSCTVTVQVTSATNGSHVNTTTAVASTNGGTGTTATDTLFVGKVSITKSFSASVFEVGGTSTITFTLTNNTGANATGVAFTDMFPGGMQNNAVAATNTCGGAVTATNGATAISLAGGAINAGASCTITKQVTGTAGGVFTNTTSGVTRTGDAVPGNPASAPYTVVAAPTVVKSFTPSSVNSGDTTTITITVSNPNTTTTVTRTGVVFTDNYPANVSNVNPLSVTLNCTAGSTAVISGTAAGGTALGLSNASIQPGGSCTVTSLVAIAGGAGTRTNAAFVSTFDNAPDPTSGAVNLTVTALTEPTVAKAFVTNPILEGATSVLRITLTNNNAGTAANGVAFTDNYPLGLVNAAIPSATITALGGSSCTGGTLTAVAGGTSLALSGLTIGTAGSRQCQIDVTVTAVAEGAYFNSTGSVTTTNTPPQNVAGTATLNVLRAPAISKSFSPASIAAGGTSTLTIVISNPGTNPINLTGVSFTDLFPTMPGAMTLAAPLTTSNTCTGGSTAGALQDSAGGGLNVGDVGIRINPAVGATIAPNGSCTITALVTAPTAGNYTNTTTAVTSTNGGTGGTASAVLSIAKLGIAKAFAPTTIANGGSSVLTFTISNPTGAARTGLTFNDDLGAVGLSMADGVVGGSCAAVTSNAGGGVTNFQVTAGNVPSPGPCTITINVTSTIAGTHNNQASGASHSSDAVPGVPSNVATLVVLAAPLVAKSFSPTVIGQNGTSQLTISLTNLNSVAMTGASFTDTYPAGMTNTAAPAASTTCTGGTLTAAASGPSVSLAGFTIPANSVCIVTVNVTSATAGSYVNSIPVGGLTTSAGANIAAGSATLTVLSPPSAIKSFSPPSVATSEESTLTITLSNPNTTAITGASFADTYPLNLRNATVPNVSTTCAGTVTASPNATNPGTLSLSGGTIPASGSCTVTVRVVSTVSGNYTNNTGSISTTNAGTGSSVSGVLTVGVPSIAKVFSPNPVQLGQDSTLTFTLSNGTNAAMTAVAFSDTFPTMPQAMVVATPSTTTNTCGGTFTATAGAGSVTFSGGTIPANSACTLSVEVRVPTAGAAIGTYNNVSGAVTAAGPLNGNTASASLVVTQAVPNVDKAFAGVLTVGGTQTLTFTITQPVGNPTQTFSFTDNLPAGLVVATPSVIGGTCSGGSVTAVAGSGTITVSGRQILNPATSCTISVLVSTATVPTIGTCPQANNTNGNANFGSLSNLTTSVTNSAAGGGTSSTGACVTVVAAVPTLDKAFTVAGGLTVGGLQTITFTVSQPTGNPTQTFSFVDTLPAGLVIATPAVFGGSCSGGSVTGTGGGSTITVTNRQIVSPATSCTITVFVTTSATPTVGICPQADNTNGNGNISGTANISASISNSAAGGGSSTTGACVSVSAATPSLSKVFGGGLAVSGVQSLSLVISQPVGNPTQTFSFTDSLPAGLRIAAVPAVVNSCTGGTVTATGLSSSITVSGVQIVNPATTCTITVNVTTAAGPVVAVCPDPSNTNGNAQIGATTNVTPAIADAAFGGGMAGAAGSGACITVYNRASLSKSYAPSTIGQGLSSTLTFTITNGAGSPAQSGLAFTDTFAGGLTVTGVGTVSGAGCAGTVSNTATSVALSAGTMTAGTASCTFTATVQGDVVGSYLNDSGAISGIGGGLDAAGVSSTLSVVAPTLTKAWSAGTINDGGTTNLVLTLTNSGTNPAQAGIAFTESLPA
ncbi:MAG: DUF11 domain-containing protein, partial [Betaproteobacteria bacterium]|nr:DUF11 domain-containing protein [Betaproteobacteria bacterium]